MAAPRSTVDTLFVSTVQHFSVGDGDGIRTTVFLQGCNLRCPWCHNPETIPPEGTTLRYNTPPAKPRTEVSGKFMRIEDVAAEVLEDKAFYGNDGGATISGGEPLLQAAGVEHLIRYLQAEGIPSVVDTAGCVPRAAFERLGDLVHTYFFDLKAPNARGYAVVGGDFETVLGNLAYLIRAGRRVRVRIPLIHKFNDTSAVTEAMCRILCDVGATEVDLLPFHRLGSGKYTALGKTYAFRDIRPRSRSHAEAVAAVYRRYFAVRVEG